MRLPLVSRLIVPALAAWPASLLMALLALPAWAADSPTLQRIRDTGVIVIGYRSTSLPFSYLDAKLKPIGYSMDLCERIVEAVAKRMELPDLEVKLIPVSSATRLPMMANGTLDLECGVTTNTVERRKAQAFSLTTFVAESKLLSKKGSGVQTVDDLRGKPVSSTIGTTSIQFLNKLNQQRGLDIRILVGQDDQEAFRAVQTDRAVAFAMDDVLLRSLVAQVSNPQDYQIADTPLSVEPYGIGLNRDDPEFKQWVDEVLRGLFKSGEIATIYRKWFQSPIPPRGLNLQLPMSEAFKQLMRAPTDSPDPAHYR
ncbi:transporter substrate-binding domain-containing protein [Paucibacter sp. APW11]|uniref:Transporter substrate-binding domain-containing protein n=1 Tax=Roseateles aquae TaxID=3077235 RepID=A0ABU3P555_9BURK|nr:transporter substrate-binding domain-containing protein [Paucibacter sp. APW11]MDT8997697.1 transporter substrate-binding domain-containing protein [Paucibacter sp. APW11]